MPVSVHDKIISCVIVLLVLFADDFVDMHFAAGIADGKQLAQFESEWQELFGNCRIVK